MERKLFYADAFPHHETCRCKSCQTENENRFESESHPDIPNRSDDSPRTKELQEIKLR